MLFWVSKKTWFYADTYMVVRVRVVCVCVFVWEREYGEKKAVSRSQTFWTQQRKKLFSSYMVVRVRVCVCVFVWERESEERKKTSLALITNVLNTTKENFPLRLTCHTLHLSVLSGDGGGGDISVARGEIFCVAPSVACWSSCSRTCLSHDKERKRERWDWVQMIFSVVAQ